MVKKVSLILFSGEVFFALFLVAGAFKGALPSFIPDVTITFMLLSMFVALKRLLPSFYINKRLIKSLMFILPFSLLMVLSLLYTNGTIYAFDKTFKFLILTNWAFIGVFLLLKDTKSLKKFLNTWLVVSIVMSFQACIIYFTGNEGFVSVFGSNYLTLGKMSSIGIIIILFLHLFEKEVSLNKKILFYVLLAMLLFSLLVSGSRMPIVALIGSLILVAPFYFTRIYKKEGFTKERIRTLIVVSTGGIILFLIGLINGLFATVINRFSVLFNGGGDSALGRVERYDVAFKMIKENIFFGDGIGSFPLSYIGVDQREYPHNIFLEIGSELGVVGITIFIAFLSYAVCMFKKNNIKDALYYCIMIISLYLFMNANVSGDLNDNRMLFSFLGIMIVSSQYYKKDSNELKINKY